MEDSFRRLEINSVSSFYEYGQRVHQDPALEVVRTEGPGHRPMWG